MPRLTLQQIAARVIANNNTGAARAMMPTNTRIKVSYNQAREILLNCTERTNDPRLYESSIHKAFHLDSIPHAYGEGFDVQFSVGPHCFSKYVHCIDSADHVSAQTLDATKRAMEEWMQSDTKKVWEQLSPLFLQSIHHVIYNDVERMYFNSDNVNRSTLVLCKEDNSEKLSMLLDINRFRIMAVLWKENEGPLVTSKNAADIKNPLHYRFMETVHIRDDPKYKCIQIAFFDSEVAPLLSVCTQHARHVHDRCCKDNYAKTALFRNPKATRL